MSLTERRASIVSMSIECRNSDVQSATHVVCPVTRCGRPKDLKEICPLYGCFRDLICKFERGCGSRWTGEICPDPWTLTRKEGDVTGYLCQFGICRNHFEIKYIVSRRTIKTLSNPKRIRNLTRSESSTLIIFVNR